MEEILAGRRDNDPLLDLISLDDNKDALLLEEAVDSSLVQRVVSDGYANDLTDDEVDKMGRDPFLICLCAFRSIPKVRRKNRGF